MHTQAEAIHCGGKALDSVNISRENAMVTLSTDMGKGTEGFPAPDTLFLVVGVVVGRVVSTAVVEGIIIRVIKIIEFF